MWMLFWLTVATALFIDLAILNKHKGNIKIKNTAIMVCVWISLALFLEEQAYILHLVAKKHWSILQDML
jgi:hypothetical protein